MPLTKMFVGTIMEKILFLFKIERSEHTKSSVQIQKSYVGRINPILSLFCLIIFSVAGSIYSLNHYVDYKKQQDRKKEFRLIKDCNIYVKNDISKMLATQVTYESTNDPDPMPKGRFVVGYSGQGKGSYDTYEKRKGNYYDYWEETSIRVAHPYNYVASLYVYDIPKDDNEDENIAMQYDKYEESIQNSGYSTWKIANCDCKGLSFESIAKVKKVFGTNQATYEAKTTKVRSVFFENKKVYVLDVFSPHGAKEHTSTILQSLTTEDVESIFYRLWIRTYSPLICMVFFCLVFLIVQFKKHNNKSYQNKTAHVLFLFCEICTIVNLAVFVVQWFFLCDNESVEGLLYLLLFAISLLFNIMSTWVFNKKSESEYVSDFLVPKQVKEYLNKRSDSESERKSVTAFVFYPFWVVSQLPFGLSFLFYVLPLSLFIFIGIECRNLYRWLYGGNMQTNEHKDDIYSFKDYYLILDLPNSASSLEIEKSFNQKMAQYNSATEKQNKELWLDLQVAYRVLISENRLRPAYDFEYSIYDSTELGKPYVFTNKKLEREINLIRNTLREGNNKTARRVRINVVLASLLIWIVAVAVLLSICLSYDNNTNTKRNNQSNHWVGGHFEGGHFYSY